MKFTLCVPAYNEEDVIAKTVSELSRVLSRLSESIDWEIVVSNNGSTDNTKDKALSTGSNRVSVLTVKEKGKGAAIHASAAATDADLFGFIDADLSADPSVIPEMVSVLQSGKYDIVICSRFLNSDIVQRGMWRSLSSKIFNVLQKAILGISVSDTQCGLKIMNNKGITALRRCRERSWFLDLEFLAISEKIGLNIKEMPVKWEEFRYTGRASKLKVLSGGISALVAMVKIKVRLYKL